jgi:hypothetical protein
VTHLRLVPAPGEAPATPTRRRKGNPSPALSLTEEESKHLKAAIRNIARTFGGLSALARALGVTPAAFGRKRRLLTPAVAVALWRLTGTPLDVLLRPTLAAVPAPAPATGDGAA